MLFLSAKANMLTCFYSYEASLPLWSIKKTFCVCTSDQSITSGEKHTKHYTTDAVYWRGKLTTRHKSLRSFSSFMITNIVMYLLLLLFTALYILGSTFFYSLSPVNSAKPNSILQGMWEFVGGVRVALLFSFLSCVLFLSPSCVLCTQYCQFVWIVHSWLPLRFIYCLWCDSTFIISIKKTFCVCTSDQSITSGEKHTKHYTTDAVYFTALYILGSTFFYSLSPVNSAKPNSILQGMWEFVWTRTNFIKKNFLRMYIRPKYHFRGKAH
jgi:hypothetical protein